MKMRTRNLGDVTAGCDPIEWIVAKKNSGDAPGMAPNLRKITFVNPEADSVYVAKPVIIPSGTSALGVRINGYSDTTGTAFRFEKKVPLPASLYIEGVKESGSINDIGFEFQFFAKDEAKCGAGALGSVVALKATFDVQRGSGARFRKRQKMLVLAKGEGEAELKPRITADKEWSYRGQSAPFARPTALKSSFRAPNQVSTAASGDEVIFKVKPRRRKLRGQLLEAHLDAICTAPTRVRIVRRPAPTPATPLLRPRANNVLNLLKVRAVYEMLDQFGASIKTDSAWGGSRPVTRENIGNVLTSPLAPLRRHIRRNLRHTPNWKVKTNARISDLIQVKRLSNRVLTEVRGGQRRFLAPLLSTTPAIPNGPILMNLSAPGRHIWFVGVRNRSTVHDGRGRSESFSTGSGTGFPQVTRNTFVARVVDRNVVGTGPRPIIELSFQAFYTIVLPP